MNTEIVEVPQDAGGLVSTEIAEFIASGIPKNTIRTYQYASKQLGEWLNGRRLTDHLLADYLKHLFDAGKAPQTIAVVVAAVKWQAEFTGADSSVVGKVTEETLRTIRRLGRGRGQVDPLTWKDVEKVATVAELSGTFAGLRDSAMIRLMSDCLLRLSEVVAVDCRDVAGGVLTVRFSKTDQEGEGASLYICKDTRKAIAKYQSTAGVDEGALFRRIRRWDVVTGKRLTTNGARQAIKKWVKKAEIEGFISGHSLRIGSAVELARRNASDVELRVAGRWKDNRMPSHYASAERAEQGAIARLKDGE